MGFRVNGVRKPIATDRRIAWLIVVVYRLAQYGKRRLGSIRRQADGFGRRSNAGEPASSRSIAHEIGAGSQAELLGRARPMGLDRLHADLELSGDFLVGKSERHELYHLGLAIAHLGPGA